jgi:hypothetical protein
MISKQSEVGPFKFNLTIQARQAILGKEMVLNIDQKFRIGSFFKPFDKWAAQYLKDIENEQEIKKESIFLSDGSNHALCKPFMQKIEQIKQQLIEQNQAESKSKSRVNEQMMVSNMIRKNTRHFREEYS